MNSIISRKIKYGVVLTFLILICFQAQANVIIDDVIVHLYDPMNGAPISAYEYNENGDVTTIYNDKFTLSGLRLTDLSIKDRFTEVPRRGYAGGISFIMMPKMSVINGTLYHAGIAHVFND